MTQSVGYDLVRSQVATADTDPNSSQRTLAYYTANLTDKDYVPRNDDLSLVSFANYLQMTFTFNDASATGVVTVYAIRHSSGVLSPLEPVCSYTILAGSQQAGETTERYWADQATVVSNPWSCVLYDNGGTDGVLKIQFDTRGYWAFVVLFTTVSSGDNISAYASYY